MSKSTASKSKSVSAKDWQAAALAAAGGDESLAALATGMASAADAQGYLSKAAATYGDANVKSLTEAATAATLAARNAKVGQRVLILASAAAKVSQRQVAEALGISQPRVSQTLAEARLVILAGKAGVTLSESDAQVIRKGGKDAISKAQREISAGMVPSALKDAQAAREAARAERQRTQDAEAPSVVGGWATEVARMVKATQGGKGKPFTVDRGDLDSLRSLAAAAESLASWASEAAATLAATEAEAKVSA